MWKAKTVTCGENRKVTKVIVEQQLCDSAFHALTDPWIEVHGACQPLSVRMDFAKHIAKLLNEQRRDELLARLAEHLHDMDLQGAGNALISINLQLTKARARQIVEQYGE